MAIKIRVYPMLSPRIIEILPPTTSVSVQEIYNVIRDWEQEPANESFEKLVEGSGKQDLGGDIMVGITVRLLNAKVRFSGRCAPLTAEGTCDAENLPGVLLSQTGIDFVATGVYPGCTVYNRTSGSMESVIEVLSSTQLRCFTLRGGSRSTWLAGDTCIVYPNVQCEIGGGNLIAIDANGDEMSSIYQSPNVQIVKTSSSSATLTDAALEEELNYQGHVAIDTVFGTEGTDYPIGTQFSPVKSVDQAKIIADRYGFRDFLLRGEVTLHQDFSAYNFEGASVIRNDIINVNDQLINGSHFKFVTLQGDVGAGSEFDATSSELKNANGLWGHYTECDLDGTNIVSNSSYFVACFSTEESESWLQIDSTADNVELVRWSGSLVIANVTEPDQVVEVFSVSGFVTLDSSCTAGTVRVAGPCVMIDNAGVGCVIDRRAQLDASPGAYNGQVTLDVDNGSPGTMYPLGTESQPVDNLADALSIAEEVGLTQITFSGEITLDRALTNIKFIGGAATEVCVIHLADQELHNVQFEHCVLKGRLNVVRDEAPVPGWRPLNYGVEFREVYLKAIEDLEGSAYNCTIEGTTLLKAGGWFSAGSLIVEGNFTFFDFRNTPFTVLSADIQSGWVQCINITENCRVEMNLKGGEVSFHPSCVGGMYYLEGLATLFNDGTDMIRLENHLIWDDWMEYHNIEEGTTGWTLSQSLDSARRILGLSHENSFIDNAEYMEIATVPYMISARIRIFDSKIHTEAATDGGTETEGLVATYTVSAEYEGDGTMKQYRMVLE